MGLVMKTKEQVRGSWILAMTYTLLRLGQLQSDLCWVTEIRRRGIQSGGRGCRRVMIRASISESEDGRTFVAISCHSISVWAI